MEYQHKSSFSIIDIYTICARHIYGAWIYFLECGKPCNIAVLSLLCKVDFFNRKRFGLFLCRALTETADHLVSGPYSFNWNKKYLWQITRVCTTLKTTMKRKHNWCFFTPIRTIPLLSLNISDIQRTVGKKMNHWFFRHNVANCIYDFCICVFFFFSDLPVISLCFYVKLTILFTNFAEFFRIQILIWTDWMQQL